MRVESIKYFIPKLTIRLRKERNLLWKNCNVDKISMRGYIPFNDKETFTCRLHEMIGQFGRQQLEGIDNNTKKEILSSAEQIVRHEFVFLGSSVVKLEPIDWHIDFKSGNRWEKMYYMDITHIPGADIKVPWELSRCQHLLWLGEAYLLTGDDKFAQEVIDEINWWIDDNPLMYSVNWKCAMDVAFRAVNWLYSLNMINSYKNFDDKFSRKVEKSLWQHGFYIYNNLELAIPDNNNHYTSNLVGLLYLGELFANANEGRKWKKFAKKELKKETLKQVLPTGVHYERSISYHRLMTEMLSYPIYMLKRLGEDVSQEVTERISSMFSYVSNYTKPNGMAPLIADNDDGRFLPFLRRDFRRHDYLNDIQSVENCFVTMGMNNLFSRLICGTKIYEDAGVGIVRKGNNYLFVNNGGYSKRPMEDQIKIGTHTHNDLLSFELSLEGDDIIVDPGTYLYTSSRKDRDEFRSTVKHNTVVVDGEEQNGFVNTFMQTRNVRIGELRKNEVGEIVGQYQTIKGRLQHRRSYLLTEDGLAIIDTLKKQGDQHHAMLYYHFAEGVHAIVKDNNVLLDNGIIIQFKHPPTSMKVKEDTLSPAYGVKVKSQSLEVCYEFNEIIEIETTIRK